MDDEAREGAEGTEREVSADGIPVLPPELSTKEQELRELVDAGASSPEELRALADKLKEKRSYEESLWKQEVRPALKEAKKRRFSLVDLRSSGDRDRSGLVIGAVALVGVLMLVLLAQKTTFAWLLVIVLAVGIYAWVLGHQDPDDATPGSRDPHDSDPDPPEAVD